MRAFLRERRRLMIALLAASGIFGATFALYHLPLEAVAYPTLLCLLLAFSALLRGYAVWRRRRAALSALQKSPGLRLGELPPPDTQAERDYQGMIAALRAENAALEARAEQKYQDTLDYYTVWAHQIKTPIASMQLTLQGEDSPLARRVGGDLGRVTRYVDMAMAFLRLDAPTMDYVLRAHDLDDIICPAVRKFAGEFIARRLRLTYEPIHETVVTDEKWLAFVLEQLLSNALKYTRAGGISIYMEAPKTLCVADTGIGIAPGDLPRIFEKGYTGANGRLGSHASGLGLYLCRRVCDALRIALTAQSRLDEGTVMRLDLRQYDLRGE